MFSVGDLNQEEIERLARAIIHVAVEESKLCSIPADEVRSLQEVQYSNSAKSDNNRIIIGRKNVITYWIH